MRILSKEIFPKCNESLEISLFLICEYLYSVSAKYSRG